jgi:GT2 family glycosyltransferase
MLVSRTDAPRVALVVVALGRTPRLVACLTSLIEHRSRTPFSITCVVNPVGTGLEATDDEPDLGRLPVDVIELEVNLGWAGGLHTGRAALSSEFFVWIQDDMVVAEGWLDALVAAAEANPDAGAFGSSQVDEHGVVSPFNAGTAEPVDDIDRWNDTDTSVSGLPSEPTRYDWVTSKGLLVRTAAWDDVGGTDPALFPLNHVDKDFCSHLRVHGWAVMLVPDAHLRHRGDQSAPGMLREFLSGWQHPRLTRRWSGPLRELGSGAARVVEHECTRERADDVEHWVARESTRLLVAFGRWSEARRRHDHEQLVRAAAEAEAVRRTLSWRITAPLRALRRLTP